MVYGLVWVLFCFFHVCAFLMLSFSAWYEFASQVLHNRKIVLKIGDNKQKASMLQFQ